MWLKILSVCIILFSMASCGDISSDGDNAFFDSSNNIHKSSLVDYTKMRFELSDPHLYNFNYMFEEDETQVTVKFYWDDHIIHNTNAEDVNVFAGDWSLSINNNTLEELLGENNEN